MQTYSFDIFDTCLVRKCGSSQNLFDLLAERVFTIPVSVEEKRLFIAARLEAADKTWSDKQTLHDIYAAFTYNHPSLLSVEELIKSEIQLEKEILVPVHSVASFIGERRKEGHRIMFISDMYISHSVIKELLLDNGLWVEGDNLYVSCEYGVTKASGKLYKLIKEQKKINYKDWHHYGDNIYSDVNIPKKLGIKSHHVTHTYTPYQLQMQKMPSLYFQWGSILAGLTRSISVQTDRVAHTDFALDIVAPLFVSFVFRVMNHAQKHDISSLYFCARDAYLLYRVACKMRSLFPNIELHYLHISRTALYEGDLENKIGYFKQIGLVSTTKKTAIVDIRSRGTTLRFLNELSSEYGCNTIYGYFFELCSSSIENVSNCKYYTELNDTYIRSRGSSLSKLPNNWYMYELYFPLNIQKRTIGYKYDATEYTPILEEKDEKEYRLDNLKELVEWRNEAFDIYTDYFIELGLHEHADNIFCQYAIPQLAEFFNCPDKHYLTALAEFYGLDPNKGFIPYVEKSLLRLPLNILKHRTIWKRGTIFYSLPKWLSKKLYRIR